MNVAHLYISFSHPHAVSLSAARIIFFSQTRILSTVKLRLFFFSFYSKHTFVYICAYPASNLSRPRLLRRDTNILYKAAEIRRIGHCIVLHEKRLAPWLLLLLPKRMINIFCFMISLGSLPTCLLLRAETHQRRIKASLQLPRPRGFCHCCSPPAEAIFTEKKLNS
jgi:hypothetical protein